MAEPKSRPRFDYVAPDVLRFDPTNPRFGGHVGKRGQDEIQALLEREPHHALQLVDSFLENGFIDYEPLVVRREGKHFIVVEGNRRLAAVRHILAKREQYAQRSTRIDDLREIPVLIFPEAPDAQDEQEQRVYLGVRHLFGFRDWPAESKARYLDSHITSKDELERTVRELNIQRNEIRRYLIPFRLRSAAKKLWKPYEQQDFWVLGEGLSRAGIKEYIELDIDADSLAVRGFSPQKLTKLLGFVYGTPRDGKLYDRRIKETRNLSTLARVLSSRRATAALEGGARLDEAVLFIETHQEVLARLGRLVRELGVLLQKVLGRGKKEAGIQALIDRFKSLQQAVKAYLKNAAKPRV